MKNCDKHPPCGRHPSEQLQALFRKRPYQGQNPDSAKYLFLSLDANLSKEIKEGSDGFQEFQAYLGDGVEWWEKALNSRTDAPHTPLLVLKLQREFGDDGIRFHQKFRQLFDQLREVPDLPQKVSFIELLPYLTYGRTSRCRSWYFQEIKSCVDHLGWVDRLITKEGKLVFAAVGVFRILERLKGWEGLFIGVPQGLKFDHKQNPVTPVPLGNGKIHVHTHFSSAVSNATLAEIAKLILKAEVLKRRQSSP